ncbi:hypothetical protein HDV06_001333 [Boothiomyces sp. JEL0866]|nr:hypothetical protein HDV06_001333 [Boothiomyces sp. JEL0866]
MEQIRKRPRIELTDLNQQEIKDIESIRDILLQEGINDDLLSFDNTNQLEKPCNITYPNNGNNLYNEENDFDDYDDFNIDEQTWNELQEQATQKLKEIDPDFKFNESSVPPIKPVHNPVPFITPNPTFKPLPVMSSQMIYPISSQRHEDPKIKELESALLEKQGEITFARNKILKLTEMNNDLIKKATMKEDSIHKNEIERLRVELEFLKQELKTVRESKPSKILPLLNQSQNIANFNQSQNIANLNQSQNIANLNQSQNIPYVNNTLHRVKFSQSRKKIDDFDMNIQIVKSIKKKENVDDHFDVMDVDIIPEPTLPDIQAVTKSVETNTFKLIDFNSEKEFTLLLSQYLSYSELESFLCADTTEFLNQHQYIVEIVLLLIEFQDYKLPSELISQLYTCKSKQLYKLLIILLQDGCELDFNAISPDYNNSDYIRLLHLGVIKQNLFLESQLLKNVELSHELIGLYCTLKQCDRIFQVIEYYKQAKDSTVFYLLHLIYHDKEILDFKEFCMVKVFLDEFDLEKRWPIFD